MRRSQFYQVKIMGLNAREASERTASLFQLLCPSKGANGISNDSRLGTSKLGSGVSRYAGAFIRIYKLRSAIAETRVSCANRLF